MFTGIIEAIGKVVELQQRGGDVRLRVATGKLDLGDVARGDSIAVNGVCLTAVELPGNGFAADVSRETLSLTSLGQLQSGSPVNLEKALTLATRLGGHLVSGHVDGLGTVLDRAAILGRPNSTPSCYALGWSQLPAHARSRRSTKG